MNNDKFQPIPNRSEIIPDVETFRSVEAERSYYLQGIIRYKCFYEDGDEIFRPIEYIRREIA